MTGNWTFRVPAREWTFIIVLSGAGFALWAVAAHREGWRLHAPDAMEYAAVARNVMQGEGLATNSILPSMLTLAPEKARSSHIDLQVGQNLRRLVQ